MKEYLHFDSNIELKTKHRDSKYPSVLLEFRILFIFVGN